MCDVVKRIEDSKRDEIILKILNAKLATVEQIAEVLQLPLEVINEVTQKVSLLK